MTSPEWKVVPNPFRHELTIRCTLSDREASITILIYDNTGRLSKSLLFNEALAAGNYEWKISGREIPAGTAYVLLRTSQEMLVKKVIRVE